MKKIGLTFYCITLMLFCQDLPLVTAVSEEQGAAIVEKCDTIKDSLRNVQKLDARTRVFLGSHFETVLSKFITPLNLRLVENNMSDIDLIENQNDFAAVKAAFNDDFVSYQQELETLIGIDCKADAERMYEKLEVVREKRKAVAADVARLKRLVAKNVQFVKKMKENF